MNVREEACKFHNLYKATAKAKKNVVWKDSVARFYNHSLRNVYKLKKSLDEDTYTINRYSQFTIHEPKERHITSTRFKDRVFQKSLCDVYLTKEITKNFIANNFACQVGKGTDKARNCLFNLINQFCKEHGTNGYYLKVDIHDFFGSTNHEIAVSVIKNIVSDKWACDEVIRIINSFDKGIGLGSQVSQLIQLAMLNDLDHIITEQLGIKYYVRYMDDFILIHNDKRYLWKCLDVIKAHLLERKLEINPKKTQIIKITRPICFLGFSYLLHPSGRITRKICKNNLKKRRRKLRKIVNILDTKDFEESYKCWRAFAVKGNSRGAILKMDKYKEVLLMDKELLVLENKLGVEKAETECLKDTDERNKKINEAISKEYSLSTQIAILRKALASMGCQEAEFVAFNNRVEEIKNETI